jgi:hypothetical protein
MHERAFRGWQFSLRGLFFVTTIVAIAAAIVGLSVGLAVLVVPLMAAGLLRTIRIAARQEAAGGLRTPVAALVYHYVLTVVASDWGVASA